MDSFKKAKNIGILGGGFSGKLLYCYLLEHPLFQNSTFTLYETKKNHEKPPQTWSFHESDVSPEFLRFLKPFLKASWPNQTYIFPDRTFDFSLPYYSLDTESLEKEFQNRKTSSLRWVEKEWNPKEDQSEHDLFFDCRGWKKEEVHGAYQKFLGLEVEFETLHGLKAPIVMDTTLDQIEGYRFMYALPFTQTTMLLEDTYFHELSYLDEARVEEGIKDYASRFGKIKKILKIEKGVLPLPYQVLKSKTEHFKNENFIPLGARAGKFHYTTGYTIPHLARDFEKIGDGNSPKNGDLGFEKQMRFFSLLNRMLFLGKKANERRDLFELFFKNKLTTIQRFYSAKLTLIDQIFILYYGQRGISYQKALKAWKQKR